MSIYVIIGTCAWDICVCMYINTHYRHAYECIYLGMYIGRHA